jgi:hypothetical protein
VGIIGVARFLEQKAGMLEVPTGKRWSFTRLRRAVVNDYEIERDLMWSMSVLFRMLARRVSQHTTVITGS